MLDYAIVVATRNRLDALRISVPLFLKQSRPPARLIIVDCSDEHGSVASYMDETAESTEIPIEVIHADTANSAQQRNLGIQRVNEEITMLPDDDSLWFPDTAEKIMKIYENDKCGIIGGVSGISSTNSPVSTAFMPRKDLALNRNPTVQRWRNMTENRIFPQPFDLYGSLRIAELLSTADAASTGHIRTIETIAGYRMSFRTEALLRHNFDPVLGSRVGYALHEDKDVGLRMNKAGLLLAAAPGAMVFHNIHQGKRAGGFEYGFSWIFNYIYICRKVFGDNPPGKRPVERFLNYKSFLYRLRRNNPYYRDVARGASAAMAEFDLLWRTPDDRLAKIYGDICDRVLAQA